MATVVRANHQHPGLTALSTLAALLGRAAASVRWRRKPWPYGADLFDVFDEDPPAESWHRSVTA